MKGYRTKKIALPGGRVIEIVYFSEPDDHAPNVAAMETAATTAAELSGRAARLCRRALDAGANGQKPNDPVAEGVEEREGLRSHGRCRHGLASDRNTRT